MKTYPLNKWYKYRAKGVDKRLLECFCNARIKLPFNVQIADLGGKRTAEQQNILFQKGASKCDGYEKLSKHQSGRAIDVVIYNDNGRPDWGELNFKKYATQMFLEADKLGIEISWAGHWRSFRELPHIQIES